MRARVNFGNIRCRATVFLVFGILLLWVVPGGAVKVERDKAKTVEKKPSPDTKKTGDTAAVSTSLLLHDVRSQKQSGSATDSLDTWIDRDGDGVNDHLKKSTAPVKIKGRGLKSRSTPAATKSILPGKTGVKKRQTPGQNTKSKTVPKISKPKSTTSDGTKKKAPR